MVSLGLPLPHLTAETFKRMAYWMAHGLNRRFADVVVLHDGAHKCEKGLRSFTSPVLQNVTVKIQFLEHRFGM